MKEDEKRNLLLNECVRIFKKSLGAQKLLAGFRENIAVRGHWGRYGGFKELSREEKRSLALQRFAEEG